MDKPDGAAEVQKAQHLMTGVSAKLSKIAARAVADSTRCSDAQQEVEQAAQAVGKLVSASVPEQHRTTMEREVQALVSKVQAADKARTDVGINAVVSALLAVMRKNNEISDAVGQAVTEVKEKVGGMFSRPDDSGSRRLSAPAGVPAIRFNYEIPVLKDQNYNFELPELPAVPPQPGAPTAPPAAGPDWPALVTQLADALRPQGDLLVETSADGRQTRVRRSKQR